MSIVEVVCHGGEWKILHVGIPVITDLDSRQQAVSEAERLAERKRARLVVEREDGGQTHHQRPAPQGAD